MFHSIFRRIDAFLRNRHFVQKGEYHSTPFGTLFETPPDPWYTAVYWAIYRFFKWNKIFHPMDIYREIKWFIQRGRRGWADRDAWGLDHYLSGWMPDALRRIKKYKMGVPSCMFSQEEHEYVHEDGCSYPPEDAMKRAEKQWDEVLDKMIAGFEAHQRIQDGLYEKEIGPYPMHRPAYVSPEDWCEHKDDHLKKSLALMDRDQKIQDEGLALFAKYFNCLWD
jgi:hypothetical protein